MYIDWMMNYDFILLTMVVTLSMYSSVVYVGSNPSESDVGFSFEFWKDLTWCFPKYLAKWKLRSVIHGDSEIVGAMVDNRSLGIK